MIKTNSLHRMVIFLRSETIQKTIIIWASYRLCIVYICQYKRQIRHLAGCDMRTKNVRRCSTKFAIPVNPSNSCSLWYASLVQALHIYLVWKVLVVTNLKITFVKCQLLHISAVNDKDDSDRLIIMKLNWKYIFSGWTDLTWNWLREGSPTTWLREVVPCNSKWNIATKSPQCQATSSLGMWLLIRALRIHQ